MRSYQPNPSQKMAIPCPGGWLLTILLVTVGCSATRWNEPTRPTGVALYENPMLIHYDNPLVLWETLADVIDDYFTIQYESPLRQQDGVVTAGRLRTLPQPGANIFEPWRSDSANLDERLRATVQSISRSAEVIVTPLQGNYLIEISVTKQIEDVRSDPQTLSLVSSANVNAMENREPLIGEAAVSEGWIYLERDPVLEQRILAHLTERLGVEPTLQNTMSPNVIDPNGVPSPQDPSSESGLSAPTMNVPGPTTQTPTGLDAYAPSPSATINTLPPPPAGTGMPPSSFSPQ